MIIWLASYPRSGNTFYRLLLNQIYAIPTYNIYSLRNPVVFDSPAQELGLLSDSPVSLDALVKADDIHVVKTHEMLQADYPAIYLVRDGRDALVSHAHYVLEYDRQLPSDEQPAVFLETLRALIETDNWFGGWSTNVLVWTSRTVPTAVVRFEDLIRAPLDCLHQSLEAVGYMPREIDSMHLPTFKNLHEQFPQFFRKGQIGSWREEMPDDLHELFWQRHGIAMRRMGYIEDSVSGLKTENKSQFQADQAVQSVIIERLKQQLEISEADRAARLEVINDLKQHLEVSEADRVAHLEIINGLKQQLETHRIKGSPIEASERVDNPLATAPVVDLNLHLNYMNALLQEENNSLLGRIPVLGVFPRALIRLRNIGRFWRYSSVVAQEIVRRQAVLAEKINANIRK